MVNDGLVRERTLAMLAGFFGILATALATVGLYGVVSYMVQQRQNEIGIRLALGSTRGQIVRLVLRQVTVLLVLGIALGAATGIIAGRTAESLLFGLHATDSRTVLLAMLMLVAIGFAACLIPARRAAGLDPMRALRRD
jgi:ABC-type antimicrobial peptide transport system permease subunit